MTSIRITHVLAVLALAATAALTPLAIRGGLRYYALNKVLRFPEARARLAVKPIRRTLTNQEPVQLVNLGYATFDTGSTNRLFIESTSSGASIVLTNCDVSIALLPPFAPSKSANGAIAKISAPDTRAHAKTTADEKEREADQMAAEISCEETQPLPPSKILSMRSDDFLLYSVKVAFKAANRIGSKGVEFFQGPYTKGIARIGQTTNDSRFAAVYFVSLDGTKNVGLRLMLSGPSSANLYDYLDPVLRSFRFTAERVDDREAVKALIRGAGIQQRKEPPKDE